MTALKSFMQPGERHRRYWRKTLVLTVFLLLVWFGVTFGVGYFARALSFHFFGWPFSFWVGAQGALLVYGLIIGFYAWYMNRLDAAYDAQDQRDQRGAQEGRGVPAPGDEGY